MSRKKYLSKFISAVLSLSLTGASVLSMSAVEETVTEIIETDETGEVSETENPFPLVTVSPDYDKKEGLEDAEELKTSENDITRQSTIELPESTVSSAEILNDKNRATKIKFQSNEEIKVSNSKTPISSVYIIWDSPVGEWTISAGGTSVQGGQYGFIHEYQSFETPVNEFTIKLPDTSATVCDIYTFSEGEVPAWVQRWNPPCEEPDILVLPARGNNEVVDFGGLLPYYAGEKKAKVQVAYMVNQWLEYYRPHEILNALWSCGVTYYPVFGDFADCEVTSYEDAQIAYNQEEVTEYVTELLRRFKPKVAVGQDLNGEGGNGISMIYAKALAEACYISGDSLKYPDSATQYGVWDVPKTYLHLYGNISEVIDSNDPYAVTDETGEVSQTAVPEETEAEIQTDESGNEVKSTGYNGDVQYLTKPLLFDWNKELESFDGKTAYEVAQDAFAVHKSQANWASMKENGATATAIYGLYRTMGEYDKSEEPDLLENIEKENQIIEEEIEVEPNAPEVMEKYKGKRRSSPAMLVFAGIMTALAVGYTVWKKFINKK